VASNTWPASRHNGTGGDDRGRGTFSTEPRIPESQLDWAFEGVSAALTEMIEPLDLVCPGRRHGSARQPEGQRPWPTPLKQQVKDRGGCGALFLDEELGGPGFGPA